MKTLYLECNMGAAGDMLTAALLELTENRDAIIRKLQGLGLPGVQVSLVPAVKCGIGGSHFRVVVGGEEEHSCDVKVGEAPVHEHHGHGHAHHSHTKLKDVETILNSLPVSEQVRSDATAIFGLIAEAESHAHGQPVEQIHFHEVGSVDAIVDVVGACLAMEQLAPDQILASPVHVGAGHVRCAHGVLPVPAPATAYILREVPIYGGAVQGELCTPTGAAILKHFVSRFCPMPPMVLQATGYGMGKKDFPMANCVRAHLGNTEVQGDEVAELSCNLDDMTPEAIAFAVERLLEAGALDVFTTPIGMKKSRPGCMLTCLVRQEDAGRLAEQILRHTTTLGVREHICRRYVLERRETVRQTPYGPVHIKQAGGREKPEYEDVARIAREHGLTFSEVYELTK